MMTYRDGEHFGFGVYADVKLIPSLAIRSMLGVFTQVQPFALKC